MRKALWEENEGESSRRRGQEPAQGLRPHGGRGPSIFRGVRGRDLRDGRTQRRGEDDHHRVLGGAPHARRGEGAGLGLGSPKGRVRAARAHRPSASGVRPPRAPPGVGSPGSLQRLLPQGAPRRPGGASRETGPPGEAERLRREALGRTEAAAVHCARAAQPPRARLPGRADHGARPSGPAGDVGPHRGSPPGGHHRLPHHALHGGGRAPLRPSLYHR